MRPLVAFTVLILLLQSAADLCAQTSAQRFNASTQSSRIWNQAFRGTGSQYLRSGSGMGAAQIRSVIPIPQQRPYGHWGHDHSWSMSPFGGFTSQQIYSTQSGFSSGRGIYRQYASSHWSPHGINAGLPAYPSGSGLYTTWPGTAQLIPLEWWWNGVPWYSTWYAPPAVIQPQINIQISRTADQQDMRAQDPAFRPVPLAPAPALLQNEFEQAVAVDEVPQPAVALQALRSQSAGDAAFRAGDYALADQHYADALEHEAAAGSVLIRRMLARISLQDFGQASGHLRQLLKLTDPHRVPLNLNELYGPDAVKRESQSAAALWDWLEQRPESADRLLLMAAFQGLHGRSSLSLQLLQQLGSIPENADQAKRLAQIISVSAEPEAKPAVVPDVIREATDLRAADVAKEDGIVIRGNRRVPSESAASSL